MLAFRIFDGSILAGIYAVHTYYASAVVNAMILQINAGCLALLAAQTAAAAFLGIDYWGEEAVSRKESKYCSHRADGVAPCSAMFPCEEAYNNKCYCSDCEA